MLAELFEKFSSGGEGGGGVLLYGRLKEEMMINWREKELSFKEPNSMNWPKFSSFPRAGGLAGPHVPPQEYQLWFMEALHTPLSVFSQYLKKKIP